jgi:hypothetical protein
LADLLIPLLIICVSSTISGLILEKGESEQQRDRSAMTHGDLASGEGWRSRELPRMFDAV